MTLTKFLIYVSALLVGSGISLAINGCSSMNSKDKVKTHTDYNGVDPLLKPYAEEFFRLSVENNLTFHNNVTMGFVAIKRARVIGTCTIQSKFREIDIDSTYFEEADPLSRKILVFHEMIHCYCSRDHDFGDGKPYTPSIVALIKERILDPRLSPMRETDNGLFVADGCAISIMHPVIQDRFCIERHYEHYLKEMFNRCIPF